VEKQSKAEKVIKILQNPDAIFLGSLSKVYQPRHHKVRSKPYWYLTWKEGGKSYAVYIPPRDVGRVRKGIVNMKKLKEYLIDLAKENLERLKRTRDVHKR
jgi:hypothetical protein